MRSTHAVVALSLGLVLGLAACASEEKPDIVMPEVTNLSLDVALSDIERAGIEEEVELLGGGMFGVVDESAWQVCEQLPAAGEVVTDTPRLTVDRSCGEEAAEPTEAEAQPEAPTEAAPTEAASAEAQSTEVASAEATVDLAPEPPAGATAEDMEAKYLEHLHNNFIDGFADMCDDSYTHWACFYDGVTRASGDLQVILTTDGGWSNTELVDLAATAGRHWFNFIGCDFPDLNVIVVTVNGLDHNVFRSDTLIDTQC